MLFTLFTTQISWETQLTVGLKGMLGLILKTSPLMGPSKEEVSVGCSDRAMNLSENTSVISSVFPARV